MREKRSEVVVITGASAGIGRAAAQRFAREGASLGLFARDRARLLAAKAEVEAAGGRALVFPLDVSDPAAVEEAAAAVEAQFGPIDVWINDAVVSVFSPVKEMQPQDYKRVNEVTYLGYVYGTLAALRRMLPRDRGIIVQVGSALAYRAIPLQSAYCAGKFAVRGFTDALRVELEHDKSRVKVTMVQMPAVNTPQFDWVKTRLPYRPQPVPPIYQPEVAAEAIFFAAHHYRREYFVSFSAYKAIWGNKIAPWFADRFLARTGYSSQQTDQPAPSYRPDNLWMEVPRNCGAHGDFDWRARSSSWAFELTKRRAWLWTAAVAVLAVLLAGRTIYVLPH